LCYKYRLHASADHNPLPPSSLPLQDFLSLYLQHQFDYSLVIVAMSNKDNDGSAAHDEKQEHDAPDETYNQQTLGEAGVWTATVAEAQAANIRSPSARL
jgi:hypothetical protein